MTSWVLTRPQSLPSEGVRCGGTLSSYAAARHVVDRGVQRRGVALLGELLDVGPDLRRVECQGLEPVDGLADRRRIGRVEVDSGDSLGDGVQEATPAQDHTRPA